MVMSRSGNEFTSGAFWAGPGARLTPVAVQLYFVKLISHSVELERIECIQHFLGLRIDEPREKASGPGLRRLGVGVEDNFPDSQERGLFHAALAQSGAEQGSGEALVASWLAGHRDRGVEGSLVHRCRM